MSNTLEAEPSAPRALVPTAREGGAARDLSEVAVVTRTFPRLALRRARQTETVAAVARTNIRARSLRLLAVGACVHHCE